MSNKVVLCAYGSTSTVKLKKSNNVDPINFGMFVNFEVFCPVNLLFYIVLIVVLILHATWHAQFPLQRQ